MRTTYNRQERRAALCIGARRPRRRKRPNPIRRIWLTAYGHDLARVAERIAYRLEIPSELAELLSAAGPPEGLGDPGEFADARRTLDYEAWALLTGEVSGR